MIKVTKFLWVVSFQVLILSLLSWILAGVSQAQEDVSGEFAVLRDLTGTVQVSHDGKNTWQAPQQGDFFSEGDWIQTAAGAEATLVFDPNYLNTVTVGESTTLLVAQLRSQIEANTPDYSLSLSNGGVNSLLSGLQPGDLFQVQTPNTIISARGTEFTVAYNVATQQTQVEVVEGEVETTPANNGEPAGTTEHQSSSNDLHIFSGTGTITPTTTPFNTAVTNSNARNRISDFKTDMSGVRAEIALFKTQLALTEVEADREILREKIEIRKKWMRKMVKRINKMRHHNSPRNFYDKPWTETDEGDPLTPSGGEADGD